MRIAKRNTGVIMWTRSDVATNGNVTVDSLSNETDNSSANAIIITIQVTGSFTAIFIVGRCRSVYNGRRAVQF
jgi:hypothetical protein